MHCVHTERCPVNASLRLAWCKLLLKSLLPGLWYLLLKSLLPNLWFLLSEAVMRKHLSQTETI